MSQHCPLMAARCDGSEVDTAEAGAQAEDIVTGKRILETATVD